MSTDQTIKPSIDSHLPIIIIQCQGIIPARCDTTAAGTVHSCTGKSNAASKTTRNNRHCWIVDKKGDGGSTGTKYGMHDHVGVALSQKFDLTPRRLLVVVVTTVAFSSALALPPITAPKGRLNELLCYANPMFLIMDHVSPLPSLRNRSSSWKEIIAIARPKQYHRPSIGIVKSTNHRNECG